MPDPRDAAQRPAWPVVLAVAGALGVVLVLLAGRYGYHPTSCISSSPAATPAWGYPDQPPLTPFVAWAAEQVGGGRLVVFRLPAAGVAVAVTVLAALTARELGGRRFAQGSPRSATASGTLCCSPATSS